jgi:hypothetical protein
MDAEANPTQISLKWFEIWRIAILHPTVETFSRIISDPKAGIKWGIIWIAISTFIAWFFGLQSVVVNNFAAQFPYQAYSNILLVGAIVASIIGVIALLFAAAISRGLARLFGGAGTFYQLFYCWAVISLPFTLLSVLGFRFPYLIPSYSSFIFSTAGMIIQAISLMICVGVNLYQLYAMIVALSAVEKLGIWKSFIILILQAFAVGVAITCLCSGFQALIMNYARRISCLMC